MYRRLVENTYVKEVNPKHGRGQVLELRIPESQSTERELLELELQVPPLIRDPLDLRDLK
jgi:hypothetical protein